MARNTDIRLAINLPFHPKIRRLVKRFGPAAGWAWIVLLCHVGADRPNGDLGSLSDEEIAIAAEWDGDAEEFVSALIAYRLLDRVDGGLVVHDWAEHNPWAAGAGGRSAKGRVAAKARWDKKTDATSIPKQCSPDAQAMLDASSSNAPTPIPTPIPTPTPIPGEEGAPDDVDLPEEPSPRSLDRACRELQTMWEAQSGLAGLIGGFPRVRDAVKREWDQLGTAKGRAAVYAKMFAYVKSAEMAKAIADGISPMSLASFLEGGWHRDFAPAKVPPAVAAPVPVVDAAHYDWRLPGTLV